MLKRNKRLQTLFKNEKMNVLIKCRRSVAAASDDSLNKIFQFKHQRSIIELNSKILNLYYDKSYKKFKN